MSLRDRVRAIPADVRVLLGIFAILAPLRLKHTAAINWMSVDGSLYTEVAKNVRDGLGLVSNLSLYHSGVEQFPYPTSVYPLWPLLLGYAAKVGDLVTLAHWLPLVLYFVSLGAAFVLGKRLFPGPLLPTVLPDFHAGHVFVLLLGLQRDYVTFSSLPYTEPLSWALLLLFFCRLTSRAGSLSLAWAVEMGVWAVLAYFTRAQMIVVPIAVVCALVLRVLAGPDRGRALAFAAVTTATITLPMAAWYARIREHIAEPNVGSLLRFDQNRATTLLSPFDVIVDTPTLWATIVDRLAGLGYAWDLLSERSYQAGFYTTHWALPFAVPFLIVALGRFLRDHGVRGAWEALRGPKAFGWAVVLLVALGCFASVQLAHKHYNGAWYFDRRQSLSALLLFYLAAAWLLRSGRTVPAALGVFVLATSTALGGRHAFEQATLDKGELRAKEQFTELTRWLKRASKDERVVVALTGATAYRVGWRTDRVGYHWFWEQTTYDDLLTMTDRLGADYVIHRESHTRHWRFRRESAGLLEHDFEELPDKPDGYTILARRKTAPPPLPKQRVIVVGVDGASWKVMQPMIERGELPTFERLAVEGASLTNFDTLDQTDSPVVWTTVATGQHPHKHGVEDYTQELPGHGKVPVTSDARKVPALWNLVTDGGQSVTVINWWASWPSEQVNGIVVSDHANPAAAGWMEGRYWKADPAALAAMNKDTWPADLAERLRGTWIDPTAFPLDELDARGQFTDAQMELVAAAPFNERTTYSWLKTFFAVDRPHLQIALDQLRTSPTDLTMLYLRGPDPVQHYAWDTVEPLKYPKAPTDLDRDRGVVQGVYRYVDTFLAELLAEVGPETTLIVLSDHGAEPHPEVRHKKKFERPGGHTRAAKGVLFVYGPHVRRGAKIGAAGPLDIAPTVAWALGLPVAEDLPGRILAEAFTQDFRERRDRAGVRTWGTRTVSASASASPADASMMEQLRGLGYIE